MTSTPNPTREVRVLLVDDEPSTHFLHKRVIRKTMPEATTISVMNGEAALEVLDAARHDVSLCPTHIWLDLQMPKLDGWAFLEAYFQRPVEEDCRPTIAIVTSSPNPNDQLRALEVPYVVAYIEKFVTPEECRRILES